MRAQPVGADIKTWRGRFLLSADRGLNGTGMDAMHGYRIFNPALQSKKFDPDGLYIRAYVPELAHVTGKWIHEPHLMTPDEQVLAGCRIGVEYLLPLVDHARARREYLDLGTHRVTT